MRSLFKPRPADTLIQGALALQLTAIVILLLPVEIWYLEPLLIGLAAAVLLFPRALLTPGAWAGISLLAAASVLREWPLPDNHDYLFVYWTLAIFLALLTRRPDASLATSARWLIVAVFLWATLWKVVLSDDYLDGRFYRVTLLTDFRFAGPVVLLGGLTAEEMQENHAFLMRPSGPDLPTDPELHEPIAVSRLATFLTWATIFLEGSVALAFLLPWGRWTSPLRHGFLLLFLATTYLIAPIIGFGWVLAILGLSQVPLHQRGLRAAYVGACFLIRLYLDVPWDRLLYEAGVGRFL